MPCLIVYSRVEVINSEKLNILLNSGFNKTEKYLKLAQVQMLKNNTTVNYNGNFKPTFLGLKYCSKLLRFLCLPPWEKCYKNFLSGLFTTIL
jgi:hypothetical protein